MDFEKLDVWKTSSAMSVEMYLHLAALTVFGFKDQITRSALSIPSNIAEGMERESSKERIKFLGYAKGSCGELRTQLYIGMKIGYVDGSFGSSAVQETRQISSMLAGLINRIKNDALI